MSELQIPEVLTVRRYMDPEAQAGLAALVSAQSGVQLTSVPLNILTERRAAVSLVAEQVYETALMDRRASLRKLPTDEVKEILEQHAKQAPTESSWMDVETIMTKYTADGDSYMIAYVIPSVDLVDEKERSNDVVSDLANRVSPRLNLVSSRLIVGSVPKNYSRRQKLVDAFEAVRPAKVRLMPVKVLTAAEAREYRASDQV